MMAAGIETAHVERDVRMVQCGETTVIAMIRPAPIPVEFLGKTSQS
jgi:hypothetical protein